MADFPVGSDVPVDTLDTEVLSTASAIGLSPLLNKILSFMRAAIAKIGTGASTPTANTVLRGTGTGTSAYGQVVNADITAQTIVGANFSGPAFSRISPGTLTTADLAALAVTQSGFSSGVTSGPTTTSTSYVTLNGDGISSELRVDLTTVGGDVLVWLSGIFKHSSAGGAIQLALSLDGAAEVAPREPTSPSAGSDQVTGQISHRFTGVPAGAHIIRARWKVIGGTATALTTQRSLLALETKR